MFEQLELFVITNFDRANMQTVSKSYRQQRRDSRQLLRYFKAMQKEGIGVHRSYPRILIKGVIR